MGGVRSPPAPSERRSDRASGTGKCMIAAEGNRSLEPEVVGARPPLSLRLLGPFEARVGGVPLRRLRTRRGYWLLALLALRHGRVVERSWLAGTLWPDSSESAALASLRQSLADLRQALGDEARRLVGPSQQTLSLNLEDAEVDLARFDAAIAAGDPTSLEQAVACYTGPFLEGWAEEWLLQERQSRHDAYVQALELLAGESSRRGDPLAAARYLRLAVAADPFRESAHRSLMAALGASGDYAAATLAYRELRSFLHRELNAAPSAETTALHEELRSTARRKAASVPPGPERRSPLPTAPELEPVALSPLPQPLTLLVGRDREVAQLTALLWPRLEAEDVVRCSDLIFPKPELPGSHAAARLVTLTGPGGVGKTRLAISVAGALSAEYLDGVRFVDLAPLSDPALVPRAVAASLDAREAADRSLEDILSEAIGGRAILLVLDNCEHLVAACARLADSLVRACPGLRVLATSQQALGLSGEMIWRVPPLSLPDEAGWLPVDSSEGKEPPAGQGRRAIPDLLECESVRLFVERGVAVRSDFSLTSDNAAAVVRICRQLDGIPLAIELAAARLRVLSAGQIADRLTDRFRLLTGGSRTALPRQQTLRAALDWSCDLLTDQERSLLRKLSVFAGGWTLEAAEEVCGDCGLRIADCGLPDPDRPIRNPSTRFAGTRAIRNEEVLDLLASLCDKSLMVAETSGASVRFRLLETVRQYSRDRLLESGEDESLRRRHLGFFLTLAEQAKLRLSGPEQGRWLDLLEAENENLRGALEWCRAGDDRSEMWLRLAAALQTFWLVRGYYAEGQAHLTAALARAGAGPTPPRADALAAAGSMRSYLGDDPGARVLLEEGLALQRELGNLPGAAAALNDLGLVLRQQGDRGRARALYEESLDLHRALEQPPGVAVALIGLGLLSWLEGEYPQARALLEEALAINRESGNQRGIAAALANLGNVANDAGDHQTARALYEEGLAICLEQRNSRGVAAMLANLGLVFKAQGDYPAARRSYERSLGAHREANDRRGVATVLVNLVGLAAAERDYATARSHLAECLATLQRGGYRYPAAFALEGAAWLAVEQDRPHAAARLIGAAAALREASGSPLPPRERHEYDRMGARTRAVLGEAGFAAAWAEGHAMSLEQALAYALEVNEVP